jgi:Probable zinc-ribbon domain
VTAMGTQILNCLDCGKDFPFPPGEQESFTRLGFPPPIRCKPCRKDRRENKDLDSQKKVKRRSVKLTIADVVQMHLGGERVDENATPR